MEKVLASDTQCHLPCFRLFGREHRAYKRYAAIRRQQLERKGEEEGEEESLQMLIDTSGINFISLDPVDRPKAPHESLLYRARHVTVMDAFAHAIRLEKVLGAAHSGAEPAWWPWIYHECDFFFFSTEGLGEGSPTQPLCDERGWPLLYTSIEYIEEAAMVLHSQGKDRSLNWTADPIAVTRLVELGAAPPGGA